MNYEKFNYVQEARFDFNKRLPINKNNYEYHLLGDELLYIPFVSYNSQNNTYKLYILTFNNIVLFFQITNVEYYQLALNVLKISDIIQFKHEFGQENDYYFAQLHNDFLSNTYTYHDIKNKKKSLSTKYMNTYQSLLLNSKKQNLYLFNFDERLFFNDSSVFCSYDYDFYNEVDCSFYKTREKEKEQRLDRLTDLLRHYKIQYNQKESMTIYDYWLIRDLEKMIYELPTHEFGDSFKNINKELLTDKQITYKGYVSYLAKAYSKGNNSLLITKKGSHCATSELKPLSKNFVGYEISEYWLKKIREKGEGL